MCKSWALDVVDKCQSTIVLDTFVDKSLVHKLWFTYGLVVFSLGKINITYGWELWSYNYVKVMSYKT